MVGTRSGAARRRAHLTPFGRELSARYRAIEREVGAAAEEHIGAIEAALADEERTHKPAAAPITRRS